MAASSSSGPANSRSRPPCSRPGDCPSIFSGATSRRWIAIICCNAMAARATEPSSGTRRRIRKAATSAFWPSSTSRVYPWWFWGTPSKTPMPPVWRVCNMSATIRPTSRPASTPAISLRGAWWAARRNCWRMSAIPSMASRWFPKRRPWWRAAGPLRSSPVSNGPGRGPVAWLGVHRSGGRMQNQLVRDLLKRMLVWAQGYAVYAEYDRSLILFMDDWGTSDKTYLPYWHYKTPTEEEIRHGAIEPLQKHHAVMDMNVDTGYVDRKTRRIVSPWQQRVVDEIDGKTIHDFGSTKRGLDAGLAAGVFFIQSHGWTHMLPDLESPPGPFWDAPMDGVGSRDWYNEFGDALRQQEVPAATQRFHMARSIAYIREDFGVTPQVIRPGGGLYSKSPPNNTAMNAARMGFGLATWNWAVYLGTDLAISLESVSRRGSWEYNRRVTGADIPWTVDAPYWLGFHDRDLSLDHAGIARLLDDLGEGIRYMNGSEYSAYLHAQVSRADKPALQFTVTYDDHYCEYFASHPSRWTVHLSDETRKLLGRAQPEKQAIEIPKGLGTHVLWNAEAGSQTSR